VGENNLDETLRNGDRFLWHVLSTGNNAHPQLTENMLIDAIELSAQLIRGQFSGQLLQCLHLSTLPANHSCYRLTKSQ
jgi:hypothetical protein